ncbi:hypothetical protein MNBD_GAMMA23-1126 [hydrothermal vent metagenome]|uniref:DUF3579 domain-containing protein n=1 Tax=hydrothermal vent metagenome TaxID=652676 RepID=A0A3B1A621_9ZZZZ
MSDALDGDIHVIRGIKEDGAKLRPSDWIERLSSTLASFGQDHRLKYNESVQPCTINGEKCLVVARGLSAKNPEMYDFVMGFAKGNKLQIMTDRRVGDRALKVSLKSGTG